MILQNLKTVSKDVISSQDKNIKAVMSSHIKRNIHVISENLALSKSELANELGVSRPTLNAAIDALVNEGVIEGIMKNGRRFLLNLEYCYAIADYLGIPSWKDTVSTTHVIPVTSMKGGTGKTTTTVNLASAISVSLNERKRVLIIDLDPQGSCRNNAQPDMEKDRDILTAVDLMLAQFETTSKYNDYHEYTDAYSHTDIVRMSCQPSQYPNLDILPAFTLDSRFTKSIYENLSDDMDRAKSLFKTEIIDHVKDVYDIIFIDCPPTLDPIVEAALEAATGFLVPVSPRKLDWGATTLYFEQLPQIVENLPSRGKNLQWFKVLLNNVEHEFGRDSHMVAHIQNTLSAENLMLKTIDRSPAFEVAAQQFRTVIDIRPKDGLVAPQQLQNAKSSLMNVSRELVSILKQQKGI